LETEHPVQRIQSGDALYFEINAKTVSTESEGDAGGVERILQVLSQTAGEALFGPVGLGGNVSGKPKQDERFLPHGGFNRQSMPPSGSTTQSNKKGEEERRAIVESRNPGERRCRLAVACAILRIEDFIGGYVMTKRPPRKVHHVISLPTLDPEKEPPLGREVTEEIDFLIELMELKPGEAILDVASGAGRHALELARREFRNVTALDLSDQLLDIGQRTSGTMGVKVNFVKGDPRTPIGRDEYDAAFILGGGAFGLMESDRENQAILDATFIALRQGGRVAVSAMNLLYLLRHQKDLSGFDPQTNYLATTENVHIEGDVIEQLPLHERYYVFPGLKKDLEKAGFRNIMGFGADTGRLSSHAITTDAPQLLLYAVKPKH
jgi:2-polyprenyl-3-methyl-5-hydroxy-6-metoxy-1,4-benzoquinol methylase